jgi:hypothetical protein
MTNGPVPSSGMNDQAGRTVPLTNWISQQRERAGTDPPSNKYKKPDNRDAIWYQRIIIELMFYYILFHAFVKFPWREEL